jgi:dTDP-glucose 4,6-dehydratase
LSAGIDRGISVTTSPPLPPEDLDHVLGHTRELWAAAQGGRFFITGGTGFFGVWLLESFAHANDALRLGMSAVVLTRDPGAFARKAPHLAARPDLAFVQGEVRDFAFPPGPFTHVIHAATAASVKLNEEAPQEMLDTIVRGTRRVLEFSAQAGVKKLLFTSSGAVYGPQPPALTHLSENHPVPASLLPGSAYAEGKRVAEQLCVAHAEQNGCEVKLARGFAFVGPHLPLETHFAIGNFIRDARRGGPVRVNGDGTPHRSYLHAADLAVWLWTILFRGPSGRAYNVGSDADLSLRALAQLVASSAGGGCEVVLAQPAPVVGVPVNRYVPDIRRAREELGLEVWIDLQAALARTAGWLAHGEAGDRRQ